MAELYDSEFVERLRKGAQGVAANWGLSSATQVRLLTLSENATFIAQDPERAASVILRVHRPAYHGIDEIRSELAWIDALRADHAVETPEILTMTNGDRIAQFDDAGETRYVVAFAFMSGTEPDAGASLSDGFATLGAISARLHQHVKSWDQPSDFKRKTWDYTSAFGPDPLWGDWRDAPGLSASDIEVLEQLCAVLKAKLDAYGTGTDRFGLMHADLRLANLLVEGDRLGVIDFDDCGFSWFAYDFAAAISFLETEPYIPDLQDAWIKGYRSVAPFDEVHVEILPTLIMFRRLLLTAWIGSHPETETAIAAGLDTYSQGTVDLARAYLAEHNT